MSTFRIYRIDAWRGHRAVSRLLARGRNVLDRRLLKRTESIVDRVRTGGDRALCKAVARYDGVQVGQIEDLRLVPGVSHGTVLPPGFENALERSIAAVERYHEAQLRPGYRLEQNGIELIERRKPLRRVGLYVPGGRASYPSTALMTVLPAKLAGVSEIVVVTPKSSFDASPALRHTLARLGVEEIWGIGGAHAVAALAYGTDTIGRVDKIAGPGNAWVTAAKHLVSADVAIDGLAGPSEVVIVTSGDVDPERVAADLLAQAEHDPQATAVLVADTKRTAERVRKALTRRLPSLSTQAVARRSLAEHGVALVVPDMERALALVEQLAPEHLQLVGTEAEALAERVRNAGAIFVGSDTPEVFGDYIAGPSHVLPTGGSARYASGLGVDDFVRRSHVVRYAPYAAARQAVAAATLADVEGLPAHAEAARLRISGGGT